MNHDRKEKRNMNLLIFSFFLDQLFLRFLSFLPFFLSFVRSFVRSLPKHTLYTHYYPTAPPFSYQAERESGPPWSRVARRVERPTRMAQHRFLPSFLSPNSRRPNSTLSSARHIQLQPVGKWEPIANRARDHSNDILAGITGDHDHNIRLFLFVFWFFGSVPFSPFHLPRASTFFICLEIAVLSGLLRQISTRG